MNLRRSMLFTLPLLLCSSLALAQETPCPAGSTSKGTGTSTSTTKDDKKAETTKKKEKQPPKKAESAGASATTQGKKAKSKEADCDTAVGQTTTTSVEQPVRRDVAETPPAEAVREGEGTRWTVAPLFGYGTADLKFGLGARAGYTFKDTPVYIGGTFLYHFGTSSPELVGATTESDRHYYYPAVEGGYDFNFGPVTVRPYGGLGILFARTTVTVPSAPNDTTTTNELMLYPGVTGEFLIPRSPVFVGADMRVLIPLEGEASAFSVFAMAGVKM
jgi:hypothetical protein